MTLSVRVVEEGVLERRAADGRRARCRARCRRCSRCGRGSRRRAPSLKKTPEDGFSRAAPGRPAPPLSKPARGVVLEAVRHVVEVDERAGVWPPRPRKSTPTSRRKFVADVEEAGLDRDDDAGEAAQVVEEACDLLLDLGGVDHHQLVLRALNSMFLILSDDIVVGLMTPEKFTVPSKLTLSDIRIIELTIATSLVPLLTRVNINLLLLFSLSIYATLPRTEEFS